ncbi:hypothetical protein [Boseongicola sp. H5]|uniref:hypothetical protein n=1 Tax=Boseongicola sp. H5 TaxID=2763261 RepID=UPI001D0AF9D8|nr:hypothetical protein [Boseongicola sp. H5]
MRHLILSRDGLHTEPDAYHRLLAACFFPESPRDQEQAVMIAAIERAEFLRVGQEGYKPSEILQVTAKLIEKRSTQLYSVGFIAVAYIWLRSNGLRPSLNRASIIASHAAYDFGKVTFRPGLDPNGQEQVKPVTGDAASLEKIFRKYRSVAHICAARVSASEYLEDTHMWDQVPEVVASIIRTTAAFQLALEGVTDVSSWNLWDVKRYFPAELNAAPVLVGEDNLLVWVDRGYRLAVESGELPPLEGGKQSVPRVS